MCIVCPLIHEPFENWRSSPLRITFQFLPHRKQSIKTNQLNLLREIIAICYENDPKHINTLCVGIVPSVLMVTVGDTCSYHWALAGWWTLYHWEVLFRWIPAGLNQLSCQYQVIEASDCQPGQLWALCMNFMKDVYYYNVDYTLLSIKFSRAESHVKMFRCSSVSGTGPFPICTVVSVHLDASVCLRRYYWILSLRKLQDIHKYCSNGHNSLKWPYYTGSFKKIWTPATEVTGPDILWFFPMGIR